MVVVPAEQLDLETVLKLSQAISGELDHTRLTDVLMRTAIEHAGAERGLLILVRDGKYLVEAETATHRKSMTTALRQATLTAADLPMSVFHFVVRTKEAVLLADAFDANQFSADKYIEKHKTKSVLCLPLMREVRLIGVLYVENNSGVDVFTPDRVAILRLIASEAAISLDNIRLYSELQERDARIRRLVDSNIFGVFISKREGRVIEGNDAFLQIVGYNRSDLIAGRVRWPDLNPPEWLDRVWATIDEIDNTGVFQPYEKEYLRKDGSRVPVFVGGAAFGGGPDIVSFVLDLTQQKHAEAALRATQTELAHANRVATLGQLTASLSHEVRQPIAAARNNARAALRFLKRESPDIVEVGEALNSAVSDIDRAAAVLDRIRDQIKRAPVQRRSFDLNEAITEVMASARVEMASNRIEVKSRLTEGLSRVVGDRVQIQQVVLNLLVNATEAMSTIVGPRLLLVSTSAAETESVLVEVLDSGPGVDASNPESIFESFYTTKPTGVGLGLSICRSIVEAHGGHLWVEPNPPKGAALRFTIPTRPAITA